ncbi:thiazole tautomerase TenI [Sutcliffiella rhizosphaerae]|uniref:Thiazole tautomerase n=1 Tax=Sutcliffiella rhizosphaerae TaxID=2880967 RepID=A0ABN8ABL7_9BACI|nr:thiazole tautomerase TenI [Sutcliffiella rhizosphaerae]CAG9622588.1 Thiazole tautomerase [Sutcliffiella rhizosphaerae]
MQLHVITDGKSTMEELSKKIADIHHQVDFIHIREKQRTATEIVGLVTGLINNGIPPKKLIINDRVDVAHVLNVGGVQLAYHSLEVSEVRRFFPELKVGRSVHSLEEGLQAEREGADFVIYGHIYRTDSKPGIAPQGLQKLRETTRVLDIPVIAIGGIIPENVSEVLATGARGVAVMSGIFSSPDYKKAVIAYRSQAKEEVL